MRSVIEVEELTRKLRVGMKWNFICSVLIGLINLSSQVLFARLTSIETVGFYAVIIIALDIFYVLFNFGLNQALIRDGEEGDFSSVLGLTIFQSLFYALFCFIAYEVIGGFFLNFDVSKYLYPAIFLVIARIVNNLAMLGYASAESEINYTKINIIRLVSVVVGLLVAYVSYYFSYVDQVYLFIIRDFLVPIVLFVCVCFVFKPNYYKVTFSKKVLFKVYKFAKGMFLLNALERVALRVDYVLVASVIGSDLIGVYYQLRAIVEGILGFVLSPIQTVLYAFSCKRKRYIRDFISQLWFVVPVFVLLTVLGVCFSWFFGKEIVVFLLGAEWGIGADVLMGLIFYFLCVILYEIIKVLSMALNIHQYTSIARVVQIIFLVIVVAPLTKTFGFLGAGIGAGIGGGVLVLTAGYFMYRAIKK